MKGDVSALDLARRLNWEPPEHLDLPGMIPDSAWPVWRRFEAFATREIEWRKVNFTAWRETHPLAKDAPDFEADCDGQRLLLVENMFSGFPDPPAWTLYIVEGRPLEARSLGSFDWWPRGWSGNGAAILRI
jgi:hypothetical protein